MTGAASGTTVHGEVSTRGRVTGRLTPLPRRQAARTALAVTGAARKASVIRSNSAGGNT